MALTHRIILLAFTLVFSFLKVNAQSEHRHYHNPRGCATMTVIERMKQEDPDYERKMIIQEKELQTWIENNRDYLENSKEVITIPVVVHVLYNVAAQNISDAQIYSQIAVLNEDFRRLNADTFKTPALFKPIAADCEIQFCLAAQTPTGQWTNGIQRRQTTVGIFSDENNNMKYFNSGGLNVWDRNRYLNIWVCNIASPTIGFAQMPGGASSTDGVVIHYQHMGRTGLVVSPFHKGRTATHEIGHWLHLYHIWGDDNGACFGTDYIDDTPNQANNNISCPNFPKPSCQNTSDMFMNYMDYTDDMCMNIFTVGQKNRMRGVLNTSRVSIKSSTVCTPLGVDSRGNIRGVMVYPNPAGNHISITAFINNPADATIRIFDIGGRLIATENLGFVSEINHEMQVDNLLPGIYLVEVSSGDTRVSRRLVITD